MRLSHVVVVVVAVVGFGWLTSGCGADEDTPIETGQTQDVASSTTSGGGTDGGDSTGGATGGATADSTTGGTVDGSTTDADIVEPDPEDVSQPEDIADPVEDVGPAEEDVKETRPPVVQEYETGIGGWTMKPGKEVTKCVLKRLNNPEAVFVTGVHADLGQGSHHLIVYKSSATEEQLEAFNCTPFVETLDGKTFPLMITQIPKESLLLPDGIAFEFEANQMVRLEAHYLNYFTEDITTEATVKFDTIAEADVKDTANMLFYGTPDFDVKAGEETQTPWHFLEVWDGIKIFGLTGHTHAYGTNVEVKHSASKEEPGEEVYPLDELFTWDEAPVTQYDPPLEFEPGAGFHYRCTWENTGDQDVGFGESANKEMCFVWAYYYPSKGYRMCVNPGTLFPGAEQVCCPDLGPVCNLIKDFL